MTVKVYTYNYLKSGNKPLAGRGLTEKQEEHRKSQQLPCSCI